jgi:hypothetical protein
LHEQRGELQGATGTMLGSVVVRNVSQRRCALGGRPSVELTNASGRSFATQERLFSLTNTGGDAISVLAPRHVAVLHVDWTNWCGRWPGRAGSFRRLFLHVALTGGSRLTFSIVTGRARCDDPKAPSLLYVSAFTNT